jgi:hypothetical protein
VGVGTALGEAEPRVQPASGAGAHQFHSPRSPSGSDESAARWSRRAPRRRRADAELLDEGDAGGRERADGNAEEQGGRGDDAAGALEAVGDGVTVREASVARFLDP